MGARCGVGCEHGGSVSSPHPSAPRAATFSGIVDKANNSALEQKVAAVFKEIFAADLSDGLCDAADASGSTSKNLASGSGTGYTYTYAVASGDVDEFKYVETTYTATFDGVKWIVDKTTP